MHDGAQCLCSLDAAHVYSEKHVVKRLEECSMVALFFQMHLSSERQTHAGEALLSHLGIALTMITVCDCATQGVSAVLYNSVSVHVWPVCRYGGLAAWHRGCCITRAFHPPSHKLDVQESVHLLTNAGLDMKHLFLGDAIWGARQGNGCAGGRGNHVGGHGCLQRHAWHSSA